MDRRDQTLGIVVEMYANRHAGDIYIHASLGRVIDRLAERFRDVRLCVPLADVPPTQARDYCLAATNIEVIPQPYYTSSLGAVRQVFPLRRAYAQVCRASDVLFIRGMAPYAGILYWLARWYGCETCHWIVGNPIALLRTHRRAGRIKDLLSLLYAWQDRMFTRLGRNLTGGAFVCNGEELAAIFRSPRTTATVSSAITEEEFHERPDTCVNDRIQILFVGILRPEKGLQYLIDALPRLKNGRDVELVVVGAAEQFRDYRAELERQADSLGVAERIRWIGYVNYGPEMFRYLREADVLVLPTLSEGTPRVLVEARANSLPIVATNVGGIPTSVQDGVDGLLVPPKDSQAIAEAVDRIVTDGAFRRDLIQNGLARARTMTVTRFVDRVIELMGGRAPETIQ